MKKVLVIEDDSSVLENTSEILSMSGYEVISAANGKEGVEIAMRELPDIIICDIRMPVLDGYGVLHLLSRDPSTEKIAFIFVTGKKNRDDFRKGMEMGADDYLTKPFESIELLNAIESRLNKIESLKKEFSQKWSSNGKYIYDEQGKLSLGSLPQGKEVRIVQKRDVIFGAQQNPQGIFFVQSGKIKTYKTHELGKELITGLFKAGDFFGYLPLMEDTPYTDSAEALEESEVCFIPKEDFFSLILKDPAVAQKFISLLADNLAEKEENLLNLAYNSVRKRVANAILTYGSRYTDSNSDEITLNITREDLANLAGTATETAIRVLGDLKNEGLIVINGGSITVISQQKLSAVKN